MRHTNHGAQHAVRSVACAVVPPVLSLASSGCPGLPPWYPPSLCDSEHCGPIFEIFMTQTRFASPLARSEWLDTLSAIFCRAQWCPLAPLTFHRLDAGCWMLAMLLGYCLGYDALPCCFTVLLVALLPLISLDAVHALYEISMP